MDRLRQRADFLAVANGLRMSAPAFAVQMRDRSDGGPIRFGFTVTRKVGTATERNRIRRRLGFGYWSLSAYLKVKVKNALQFIENFEAAVAEEARRRGVDGVICGHIHKAEMRDIDGVAYINDGDWVESCTALVEHLEGSFEILEWAKMRSWSVIDRLRAPAAELEEPAAA